MEKQKEKDKSPVRSCTGMLFVALLGGRVAEQCMFSAHLGRDALYSSKREREGAVHGKKGACILLAKFLKNRPHQASVRKASTRLGLNYMWHSADGSRQSYDGMLNMAKYGEKRYSNHASGRLAKGERWAWSE